MTANNDSVENTFFEIEPKLELIFKLIYYSVSILSVAGNILILLAVFSNKKMQSVTNFFIANLAASDIILSLFSTPFQVFICDLNY
jgi:hypothetical protein